MAKNRQKKDTCNNTADMRPPADIRIPAGNGKENLVSDPNPDQQKCWSAAGIQLNNNPKTRTRGYITR